MNEAHRENVVGMLSHAAGVKPKKPSISKREKHLRKQERHLRHQGFSAKESKLSR